MKKTPSPQIQQQTSRPAWILIKLSYSSTSSENFMVSHLKVLLKNKCSCFRPLICCTKPLPQVTKQLVSSIRSQLALLTPNHQLRNYVLNICTVIHQAMRNILQEKCYFIFFLLLVNLIRNKLLQPMCATVQ